MAITIGGRGVIATPLLAPLSCFPGSVLPCSAAALTDGGTGITPINAFPPPPATSRSFFEPMTSYWFYFTPTIDRPDDVAKLKEILFWGLLYHMEDSNIKIFHPAMRQTYIFNQRIFGVTQVPSLILSDRENEPNDFVKLSPGLLTQDVLGQDFSKLRDIMEHLHTILMHEGSLAKVQQHVYEEKFTQILSKVWKELKSFISINVTNG